MASPLRVGLAGVGTVGASVIKLLERQSVALANRTGRSIEVRAVSARDRQRERGVDIAGHTWFDDPVDLAKTYRAEIQIFQAECSGSSLQILLGLRQAGRSRTGRFLSVVLYVFGYANVVTLWLAKPKWRKPSAWPAAKVAPSSAANLWKTAVVVRPPASEKSASTDPDSSGA